MTRILVTGGTGGLGAPTVRALNARGHEVEVLSRSARASGSRSGRGSGSLVLGDLSTGDGVADALRDIHTVVHLATSRSTKDSAQTRLLLAAAQAAGVSHVVFMSIVGIDRIGYSYYRDKLACEVLVEESGIPFTILRATQFHDFLASFFRLQRRLPVLFALNIPIQPIAVEEVARRLSELVDGAPAGRVTDIGGPETKPMREFAAEWKAARRIHKPVWMTHLPGKAIREFKAGHHTTQLPGYGSGTFAQYAEANP